LPSSGNTINDAYIVTASGDLYVWNGSAWTNVGPIVGPAGPTGPTGSAGNWTSAQPVTTKTANYTITAGDVGYLIIMNSASAVNLTVPSGLGLTQGQRIDIFQLGAGQVTVVASGTTIRFTPTLKLRTQYSSASLIVGTTTNHFYLVGDLAAS
jgi:hypothetical protein